MVEGDVQVKEVEPIAPEIIRVAVARVCASSLFEQADRLQALLHLLTDKAVSEGDDPIDLKEVWERLYDQHDFEVGSRIALADSRRLADLLKEYYLGVGSEDALSISLDATKFKLRFAFFEQAETKRASGFTELAGRNWALYAAMTVVAIALVGFVFVPRLFQPSPDKYLGMEETAASLAEGAGGFLMHSARDAAELTVEELDMLGRAYLFPFMDIERQKRAVRHFKAVIERDKDYAGAYASAAHSLGSLAVVTRGSGRSRLYLEEALQMRDAAAIRAPDDPWTLSAAAWVAFAEREFERAISLSDRAYRAAPRDGLILDFYGLVALFTGQFNFASMTSAPGLFAGEYDPRLGNHAIYGFAMFHLGDYETAIKSFETAIAQGTELNAIRAMYLSAAYQAAGRTDEAQDAFQVMKENWPMFRPELVYELFMQDTRKGIMVLDLLAQLGWEFDN